MSTIFFVVIILIYFFSWISKIKKTKIGEKGKKTLSFLNIISFCITIILIIMWAFQRHLTNLTIELIPFWVFIISSISIFGLTEINRLEKVLYGIIFWGHLFLTTILIIPYIGLGISLIVYSNFLPDRILYNDEKIIITEESRLVMSPKSSPKIYVKCGLFAHKYDTDLSPIYSLDSVSIKEIIGRKLEIRILNSRDSTIEKTVIKNNCL